jgi:uncharacterized protein (TIGR02678 family)
MSETLTQTAFERVRVEEAQRPFADLLDTLVIAESRDPAAYRRIRPLVPVISDWFNDRAALAVQHNGSVVRLVRELSHAQEGQGFEWAETPLHYELLAWILWYQDKVQGDQFLLSDLAARLPGEIAQQTGFAHLSLLDRSHRQALRDVLRRMTSLGLLECQDDDLEHYAQHGRGNAIYTYTTAAKRFVVPTIPEAAHEDRETFIAWVTGGPDPRITPLQRAYRALLFQPVFYADEDPDAFAALTDRHALARVARDIDLTLGWHLEVTATYAAVLRPSSDNTGLVFPKRGTLPALQHVVLLLCAKVRAEFKAASTGQFYREASETLSLSSTRLEEFLDDIRRTHHEYLNTELRDKSGVALLADVTEFLRVWRMADGPDASGWVHFRPVAGRYGAVLHSSLST